ncbi:MAG TPA: 3-oxoacyl-[acyl-carrier-protein] synthase III C-terminal domain-containing protein [Candidatus Nanopelagicales bacterium]|nr:3-oxoacyl-[acyl-carrier-protein] synthase III C-terminal domain-containing protein [Candidatus Nanopelagicales bacterium]
MSRIAAAYGAVPPYRYAQDEITRTFADVVDPDRSHARAIASVHAATGVEHRHLALPLEEYAELKGFGQANDAFIRVGLELAAEAVVGALAAAGLAPQDVDLIVSTSVTGIAAPSLDAMLVERIGLREDVKRVPIFGLGCVAGAAGVARVHDHLVGHPDDVAVLLSVELCSLTVQRDDVSMANVVASGLFGDGAAAVVMVGDARQESGPTVVASRSRLYPDSARTMGWDIGETGFRIVLAASVPDLVTTYLGDDVRRMLADHDLAVADVATWVCHPGGPKVLLAMEDVLDLRDCQLDVTWRSLAAVGNLSSASVLHVLADTLDAARTDRPAPGEPAVMMAMGPGFCSELVLLRW